MEKSQIWICKIFILLLVLTGSITGCSKLSDAPIVLTPTEYNATVLMPGTYTLAENSILRSPLEERPILKCIEGLTYEAGMVFRADFNDVGILNRGGQMWNVTDKDANLHIAFYKDESILFEYDYTLMSGYVSRIVKDGQYSEIKGCNKVVITGLRYLEKFCPALSNTDNN